MAVNRVAAFLEKLRTSQLVPPATVEQLGRSPLAQGDDPAPLARELVRQGCLTPYQARQLARGKDLVIGQYRLLELERELGPAQVFKALHIPMNCTVGLKVVRKDRPADAEALKREYQILVGLTRPAFLKAYEAGSTDEACFFAFEHVEGVDLERRVADAGPLAAREACEWIRQAALGLQHAHDRGVIVRTILPARLLITQPAGAAAGVLKFLDLGSARRARAGDGSSALPADGWPGPQEFVAPELRSDPLAADPRSDLYSLGCVFAYLLTGRPPAAPTTVAPPGRLTGCRDDVPPVLQAIVLKLLNRRPEERFATAAEVASVLTPFSRPVGSAVANRPVPAAADSDELPAFDRSATPAAASVTGRAKKDRSLYLLAGVGLLSVAGLLVLGAVLDPDLNPFGRHGAKRDAVARANDTAAQEAAGTPEAPAAPRPAPPPVVAPPAKGGDAANVKPAPLPPLPAVEPKPEPKAPVRVKAKHPIPDVVKQAEAEKLVRETYAEDYALLKRKPAEYVTLANKFMHEAGETDDNPTVQYILFREAGEFAARGGDLDLVMTGIDEVAARFAVNPVELKAASLARAAQGTISPVLARTTAEIALELAGEALDEDNYQIVLRFLEIAETAAKKAISPALLAHVQKRIKDINELAREYGEARAAAATLAKNALDADASLLWGRFLTFYKGNWGAGLPLLARGSNPQLAKLARDDLAAPDNTAGQLQLADAWWEVAGNLAGLPKKQVLQRARYWYDQALAQLSGFNKTRVEKRLKELEQLSPKDEMVFERSAIANVSATEKFNRLLAAGQYYFKAGNYVRAGDAFAEALKLKPDDARATTFLRDARYYQYMAAGYLFANMGRLNEAGQQFESALEQRPNDAIANSALNALGGGAAKGSGKTKGGKAKN